MLKSIPCMDVLPAIRPDRTVVVVSGLPRSGTSMLMRTLASGGLGLLTDEVRDKNEQNPFGYLEWEPVKDRNSYLDWIEAAAGKSVKVVSRFITYLPAVLNYRILFIHRGMEAVLRSQRDMAHHYSDASWNEVSVARLGKLYADQVEETLRWIDDRPNMRLHRLNYEDMLTAPDREIERICHFLTPWRLDAAKMRTAIDPALNHATDG